MDWCHIIPLLWPDLITTTKEIKSVKIWGWNVLGGCLSHKQDSWNTCVGATHSCLPSCQKLSPLLQGFTCPEHRARAELCILKPGIVTRTGIWFDFPCYARLNSYCMSSKTFPCRRGRVGTRWQELLRLFPGRLSPLLKSHPGWLYISVMQSD